MNSEKKQFIYILKLIPNLIDQTRWTKKEENIVDRHFAKLQKLLGDGKLILAGRTLNMDEKTFGIVIIEVESEEEALNIMNNDPAVSEGVMTAELFPYRVALIRTDKKE
jgi:uncharacterized protein YciI